MSAPQPHQPAPAPLSRADGKFALSATPGTADGYPARYEEARFITPGGGSFPVPYGHLLKGNWGGSAIYWAVGDELQPVPESLEIRWFSYPENKFYEGHFPMPQAHLRTLLERGLWERETKSHFTYSTLNVCVVPGGIVVVWLSAGQSNKVLIGRYQAHEIAYDYDRFRPGVDRAAAVRETKATLSAAVKHEIATGTLSSKKWDAYLRQYPWKLEFSRPLTLTRFAMGFFDAEAIGDPSSADAAVQAQLVLAPSPKPVPKTAMLYVAGPYGRQRLFKLVPFDETETLAAFQTLHAQHPKDVITLYVDTDERLSKATLSLRAGGQVIPLTKTSVQFFDLP
ncbi:hypothetical protein GCM10027422_39280 [Hymenobacter arcticus]